MMCVVTLYLCTHNITSVLANIPQQSIQSCTPFVNKQFAPDFHSDLMTGWRHIEKKNDLCKWGILLHNKATPGNVSFLNKYCNPHKEK